MTLTSLLAKLAASLITAGRAIAPSFTCSTRALRQRAPLRYIQVPSRLRPSPPLTNRSPISERRFATSAPCSVARKNPEKLANFQPSHVGIAYTQAQAPRTHLRHHNRAHDPKQKAAGERPPSSRPDPTPPNLDNRRGLLFEPLKSYKIFKEETTSYPRVLEARDGMSVSAEILKTPTADTPGTTVVLRTANKAYLFGSQAEGTQRALVQQGTRLLKVQDFFLTGQCNWGNTGGFVGLMLTLADASTTSYQSAKEVAQAARQRGRKVEDPPRPKINIYGPPNLKHTLGTCRRFIFRRGIPIQAIEYTKPAPPKDENGTIPSSWRDSNIEVWALNVSPVSSQFNPEAEQALEARRQTFDSELNSFGDHQAPENENAEDREARYDSIRDATLKFMFDSNWTFDTLVEQHISKADERAAWFVRDPETHQYQPYNGSKSEPFPDTTVWTRTPWPGATIKALPPTAPNTSSVSYIVRTLPSRGVFDVARAKELGVKPGPDFGKLAAGQSVQNQNGETISSEQVVGADRPGQGFALLDVPSIEYLEAMAQRDEFTSEQVMAGIGAFVWMLGPGLAGHPALNSFMRTHSSVQHIIASTDTSPNRLNFDSVAGQALRLAQVDPARYSVPVHDNETVPQKTLSSLDHKERVAVPDGASVAERGISFVLMPKFLVKPETKNAIFDVEATRKQTDPEILRLAEIAQRAVKDDQEAQQKWRQLLARPNTEVITLGTGSALPSKYRNVSATLVRVPDVGNYLFDAGENTLGQLARVFQPEELADVIRNLRMIWISHLHADHHLGTASVIRAWYDLVHNCVPNDKPQDVTTLSSDHGKFGLSVISHSGMLQWLHEYSSVEDFGYSRILPLELFGYNPGRPSELHLLNTFNTESESPTLIHKHLYERLFGFVDIQSAGVAHCHGAMAVSVTFPPSPTDPVDIKPLKVSYSGDCRPSQKFARAGKDTTVLIHEATFDDELQGDAIAKKHSTTSEALGIGSQMNAKAVVLTHFSQRYQKIPVLQTVTDGEQEDPLLDPTNTAQEANENGDNEVDPTLDNPDNMDIHPTASTLPSTTAPGPSLKHQSSSFQENERIIKVRNKDMKVAIAFDYMRVKIGEIAQLDKFNDALNALLVKEDEGADDDTVINANGKKTSGDEAGGSSKKKQKQKQKGDGGNEGGKKAKSKRNN